MILVGLYSFLWAANYHLFSLTKEFKGYIYSLFTIDEREFLINFINAVMGNFGFDY